MDGREELVLRLAAKRRAKLELSDSGYAELLLAVREDPERFMEDGSDEAFAVVARAVAALDEAREGDDLLDDGEFFSQRAKRMEHLGDECVRALALDPHCTEAQLLLALGAYRVLCVRVAGGEGNRAERGKSAQAVRAGALFSPEPACADWTLALENKCASAGVLDAHGTDALFEAGYNAAASTLPALCRQRPAPIGKILRFPGTQVKEGN